MSKEEALRLIPTIGTVYPHEFFYVEPVRPKDALRSFRAEFARRRARRKKATKRGSNEPRVFENINSPTPFIKPFPEFKDVFSKPMALHKKHFLPLVSVDASVVHPDLKIWLHFVTPIEPLLELDVGYFTREYHDFYNKEGQVAFQIVDGKYSFTGDPNYFAYESGAIFKAFPNRHDEIHDDYDKRIASWKSNRKGFRKHGHIPYSSYAPYDPAEGTCGPLVTQLGGEPVLGNWETVGMPVNRSGKPFRYIGEVQGFSYCEGGIQAIQLFFDPNEQIALFRFDYT